MSGAQPHRAAEISEWDARADVVIAGYGIAGVCAAIEAARAGADVLILERTGGWGGAAALAGGFVYLGGGTPLQQALGFDDDAANMEKFLLAAVGPSPPQRDQGGDAQRTRHPMTTESPSEPRTNRAHRRLPARGLDQRLRPRECLTHATPPRPNSSSER
ncbi:FAD-dependent oxidoreductase [Amycolatopsis sp. NPDC003676]